MFIDGQCMPVCSNLENLWATCLFEHLVMIIALYGSIDDISSCKEQFWIIKEPRRCIFCQNKNVLHKNNMGDNRGIFGRSLRIKQKWGFTAKKWQFHQLIPNTEKWFICQNNQNETYFMNRVVHWQKNHNNRKYYWQIGKGPWAFYFHYLILHIYMAVFSTKSNDLIYPWYEMEWNIVPLYMCRPTVLLVYVYVQYLLR